MKYEDELILNAQSRKITGMSATLLPFLPDGSVDWDSFDSHVERTIQAGLIPAVNMDTGYVNLLDDKIRRDVLRHTKQIVGRGSFVAGAYVSDTQTDRWNLNAYRYQIDLIQQQGGIPVIFQSFGFFKLLITCWSGVHQSYG